MSSSYPPIRRFSSVRETLAHGTESPAWLSITVPADGYVVKLFGQALDAAADTTDVMPLYLRPLIDVQWFSDFTSPTNGLWLSMPSLCGSSDGGRDVLFPVQVSGKNSNLRVKFRNNRSVGASVICVLEIGFADREDVESWLRRNDPRGERRG